MLNSCLRHPWISGVATAVVAAAAVYVTAGDSFSSSHSNKEKNSKDGREGRGIKPAGLVNEGNTCFINATMQALAACHFFLLWLDSVVQGQQEENPSSAATSLHTTLNGIHS